MVTLGEQADLIHQIDPMLLRLLQVLNRSLRPRQNDVVEFNFYSSCKAGVLVYPNERRPSDCFNRLFAVLNLPSQTVAIFWALLSRIPAERHAVRLLSNGAVSVFFKIDFPAKGIPPLCSAIGVEGSGKIILSFFERLGLPACGIALELSPLGATRLRFYHMVPRGREGIQRVIDLASSNLGIKSPKHDRFVAALDHSVYSGREVVVGVGTGSEGGCSIKYELPDVDSAILPTMFRLESNEEDTWRAARHLALCVKREIFPYIGVRFSSTYKRETTFYVDVGPLLHYI